MARRIYLETLQRAGGDAFTILDNEKRELDESWALGITHDRTALRRRYVAGVKRLEELHVALGGEAGKYEPLDPDTRPMRLDR